MNNILNTFVGGYYLSTNHFLICLFLAKGLVGELALLHAQSAWGLRGERIRAAGLIVCCNYFSKKKKKLFLSLSQAPSFSLSSLSSYSRALFSGLQFTSRAFVLLTQITYLTTSALNIDGRV